MQPEATGNFCDVDVIIPAYRARDTIARALASVAEQSLKPRQAIVVVDGSDDGTLEAANACRDTMGDIGLQVIWQENKGAGAARNRAVEAATATYLAFLDADDEWLPEKLDRSLAVMAQTNVDMVSHDCLIIDDDQETATDCARHFLGRDDPFVSLYLRGYIATSTVIVKRSLVTKAGGFNPSLPSGQDFDLWLTILGQRNASHHVFSEVLTHYYVMSESITSRIDERRRCGTKILLRHAPSLRGRGLFGTGAALIRSAIVHIQAAAAYRSQGRPWRALSALASAPMTVIGTAGRLYARPLLWLWIGGIAVVYGLQFEEYIDPIMKLVGLK